MSKWEKFEDEIWIYTNPFFWIYAIGVFIIEIVKYLWQLSTIADWYFAYFKMRKLSDKQLDDIIHVSKTKQESKRVWFMKKIMWKYGAKKAQELKTKRQ